MFTDTFLTGLRTSLSINHSIDRVRGDILAYESPYRLFYDENAELDMQMTKLLEVGFIAPTAKLLVISNYIKTFTKSKQGQFSLHVVLFDLTNAPVFSKTQEKLTLYVPQQIRPCEPRLRAHLPKEQRIAVISS